MPLRHQEKTLYSKLLELNNFEDLLDYFIGQIQEICDFDGYYLAMLQHSSEPSWLKIEKIFLDGPYHSMEQVLAQSKIQIKSETILENVLLKKKAYFLNKQSNYSYDEEFQLRFERWEIEEALVFPIMKEGQEPLGIFLLFSRGKEGKTGLEDKLLIIGELVSLFYYPLKHTYKIKKFQELEKDLLQKTKHNQAVMELAQHMNNLSSVEKIITLILKEITNLFHFDMALIFLLDKDFLRYSGMYARQTPGLEKSEAAISSFFEEIGGYLLDRKDGATVVTFMTGNQYYFNDLKDVQALPMAFKDQEGIARMDNPRSLLLTPIVKNNESFGVLQLWKLEECANLTQPQMDMLFSLCRFVGSAIANAQLYSVVEEQKNTLMNIKNELESLNEITKQISMSLDFQSVIDKVITFLMEKYFFQGCLFVLFSPTDGKYYLEKVYGDDDFRKRFQPYRNQMVKEENQYILETIVRGNLGYFKPGVGENHFDPLDKAFCALDIDFLLTIPINVDNKVIGAFTLTQNEQKALSSQDLESIERFVVQVASAIKNSMLYNEMHKANQELGTALKEKTAAEKNLKRTLYELEKINNFNIKLNESFDFDDIIQSIIYELRTQYGFESYLIHMVDEEKEQVHWNYAYDLNNLMNKKIAEYLEQKHSLKKNFTFVERAVNTKSIVYEPDSSFIQCSSRESEWLKLFNVRSLLLIPFGTLEKTFGIFIFINHREPTFLEARHIQSIQRFINQISTAIRNIHIHSELEKKSERLEGALTQVSRINKVLFEDLQMAKLIQTNILSEEYKIKKNLEFEVFYEPMMEVGGDIYDIFELSHNYYRVFVADATGHGIQAALTTMIIKGEYDKIKKTEGLPYIILAIFNNIFTKKYLNLNVFFTCIVMDIDLNRNIILYSTAGQPDQYLLHEGKLEVIPGGGKMIGILENMKFLERETAFVPGDKLLLFSDGLFEQFSQSKEELGEARFSELVEKRMQERIGTLVPHLVEDVKEWIGGGEVNDDICVVGIEYPKKQKKFPYGF